MRFKVQTEERLKEIALLCDKNGWIFVGGLEPDEPEDLCVADHGRVVMMVVCPKFDGAEEYIEKFAEIFKTAGIKSNSTVYIEVPCCSGLPMIQVFTSKKG